MQTVAEKWLAARRLTDAPATVEKLELGVRTRSATGCTRTIPRSTTFADVTRDHCLGWISSSGRGADREDRQAAGRGHPDPAHLRAVAVVPRHRGLGVRRRPRLRAASAPATPPSCRSGFRGSSPTTNSTWLMPVINEIACPFQRAALLVARWSGARRDEIRRLPLDCLDHYPDGTPRLRLPGRKTYKERDRAAPPGRRGTRCRR